MIVTLSCPCGRVATVSTLLNGGMVRCADCGFPNAPRLPVAATPAESIALPAAPAHEGQGMLPSWIVAPLLMYLTYVASVIVAIGWCMTSSNECAATVQVAQSHPPERQPANLPRPAVAPPIVDEPPIRELEIQDKHVNESFTLPRRTHVPEDEPSVLPAKEVVEKIDTHIPPPTPRLGLGMPIEWKVEEKPRKGGELFILPVEVADVATGPLHFSLRRLRLDDETRKPLRLAVTPPAHDDVGSILNKMGPGYRYTTLRNQDLLSLPVLRNFDVLFLTCADMYAPDFQAALPLRKYVEMGGTLYASDLRGDLLLTAFPEFRTRLPIFPGVPQAVESSVVDVGLQAQLGRKSLPLTFDAPGWRPAAFDEARVNVCLRGEYRNQRGEVQSAPLLVKFRVQRGTVIFTSFHHTKNDSEVVRRLLDYLVFASVNARSEARVRAFMERYDFAPADLRPTILSAGRDAQGEFKHSGGGLQIALGFENQGAKLKLTLRSPTGQTMEHEDLGIYLIDVPKAPAGTWQYTVTPIDLPHANFPIVVGVGTVKK